MAFADDNDGYFWDRPSKVGEVAFFLNGTQFRRGQGFGTSAFITHERLKSRDFIKGDDVYILLTMEGTVRSIVPPKLLLSLLQPRMMYRVLAGSTFRCINQGCERK